MGYNSRLSRTLAMFMCLVSISAICNVSIENKDIKAAFGGYLLCKDESSSSSSVSTSLPCGLLQLLTLPMHMQASVQAKLIHKNNCSGMLISYTDTSLIPEGCSVLDLLSYNGT